MTELALQLLDKYYKKDSIAYEYLYTHSLAVTQLALKIADYNKHLNPDKKFIKIAAFLHDIGICMTDAPDIGCHGQNPYLAHGYLGRELLEKEGMDEMALICERHVGVGITVEDIKKNNLPLPFREMVPISIEEKIICYADKFYSKKPEYLTKPKPVELINKSLSKHDPGKVKIFEGFIKEFGIDYIYN